MANWCSNSVVFQADQQVLEAIQALFAEMEQKQTENDQYFLPSFITKTEGVMTDFVFDKNRILFETRWSPNIETLMEIADFYQAGFTCRYEEMSNGLYGEARYDRNTLTIINLDREDFQAIRYDKQRKGYPFGEQVFEYEGDLLDYILEQKLENNTGSGLTVRNF